MSSDAEVIFPFLFWFIYKWVEVWSKSQYCTVFKNNSWPVIYIHTYTFSYKCNVIYTKFTDFDLMFCADIFIYAISPFPAPTPVTSDTFLHGNIH